MKKKILARAGLALLALALSGCSTFLRGTYEKITVVSTPPQALCRMYRESEGFMKSIATPGSVYLMRSEEPVRIVCTKKGFKTTEVMAKPIDSALTLTNVVGYAEPISIVSGMMLDTSNAADAELPDVVSVTMEAL